MKEREKFERQMLRAIVKTFKTAPNTQNARVPSLESMYAEGWKHSLLFLLENAKLKELALTHEDVRATLGIYSPPD